MRLSQLRPYLPSLACRQLHVSHGVFLAFHEGPEQSLFQKTFAYLLRVDIRSNTIVSFEALVRWRHPSKGLVGPAEFIAASERTNAILPLGLWALHQAAEVLNRIETKVKRGLCISVNISARQFSHPALLIHIREILKHATFSPPQLELELTESILIDDPAKANIILGSLKEMGVRLAIDDFGTGYSSLSYLRRLPFDCLKIDASFVRELPSNRNDAAITRAVIAMGHELGLKVVAEGVERSEQLAFLASANAMSTKDFSAPRRFLLRTCTNCSCEVQNNGSIKGRRSLGLVIRHLYNAYFLPQLDFVRDTPYLDGSSISNWKEEI